MSVGKTNLRIFIAAVKFIYKRDAEKDNFLNKNNSEKIIF